VCKRGADSWEKLGFSGTQAWHAGLSLCTVNARPGGVCPICLRRASGQIKGALPGGSVTLWSDLCLQNSHFFLGIANAVFGDRELTDV
jgi:hypothetical protein